MSIIGIFDSGVGGLSVLRELRKQLPNERLIFLADQAHVPYGPRPLEVVRSFAHAITRFLRSQGAELVVVACNTASAAALHSLRQTFPSLPFVGMEPAVKPAAEVSRSRVVGVLATPATFQGALYASVVERFAQDVTLLQHTCPGLVQQIESGRLTTPKTHRILEDALQPMLAAGIDTIVLGCTHYPFVIPLIEKIVGPQVRVIDPAPAVARQASRMLQALTGAGAAQAAAHSEPPPLASSNIRLLTTGNARRFESLLPRLLGETFPVETLHWDDNRELWL